MILKFRFVVFKAGEEYRVPCTVYRIGRQCTLVEVFILERPVTQFGSPMAEHVRVHTAGSCDTCSYTFVDPPLLRRADTLTRSSSLSCYDEDQ